MCSRFTADSGGEDPFGWTSKEAHPTRIDKYRVLDVLGEEGLDASHVRRLGIPDRFIEHGGRDELLAGLSLDAAGIAATCRELAAQRGIFESDSVR